MPAQTHSGAKASLRNNTTEEASSDAESVPDVISSPSPSAIKKHYYLLFTPWLVSRTEIKQSTQTSQEKSQHNKDHQGSGDQDSLNRRTDDQSHSYLRIKNKNNSTILININQENHFIPWHTHLSSPINRISTHPSHTPLYTDSS